MVAQLPRDGQSFWSETVGCGGEHVANLVIAIVRHELGNRDRFPASQIGKMTKTGIPQGDGVLFQQVKEGETVLTATARSRCEASIFNRASIRDDGRFGTS